MHYQTASNRMYSMCAELSAAKYREKTEHNSNTNESNQINNIGDSETSPIPKCKTHWYRKPTKSETKFKFVINDEWIYVYGMVSVCVCVCSNWSIWWWLFKATTTTKPNNINKMENVSLALPISILSQTNATIYFWADWTDWKIEARSI